MGIESIAKKFVCVAIAGAAAFAGPSDASAALYHYVDWTDVNPSGGTASGVITLPDTSTVTVDFEAINPDSSPGSLKFAQTNGGTNYWNPSTPYISAQVDNAPPGTDIVSLIGGANQTYRVTLSEAIKDPIMSIVSLGQPNVPTTYDFDSPFTIVSQGTGFWGGGAAALEQLPGDILRGREGHGTIQFLGTFSTFTWEVPTPEDWHGFTFGIRTTVAIEPDTSNMPNSTVPEPVTGVLGLMGFGVLGMATRRRVA